jgi:hypothetical protein
MDPTSASPLVLCRQLFEAAGGTTDVTGDCGAERLFAQLFEPQNAAALAGVPLLSAELLRSGALPPNSLVRYRGMVQDMFDPEYFVSTFVEVCGRTGAKRAASAKYSDTLQPSGGCTAEADPHGRAQKIDGRLPLYCVAVPGEAAWAAPAPTAVPAGAKKVGKVKRALAQGEEEVGDVSMAAVASSPSAAAGAVAGAEDGASKRVHFAGGTAAPAEPTTTAASFPCAGGLAGGSAPLECILKVYDMEEALEAARSEDAAAAAGETLAAAGGGGAGAAAALPSRRRFVPKLHDAVEVIGVLSIPPPTAEDAAGGGADDAMEMDAMEQAEFDAHNPPNSRVPRVHCLALRRLPGPFDAGLAATAAAMGVGAAALAAPGAPPMAAPMAAPAAAAGLLEARGALLRVLGACELLRGDELAAEYLLLHLLSAVRARPHGDAAPPIGHFPLNLSLPPPLGATAQQDSADGAAGEAAAAAAARAAAQQLHGLLAELLPRVVPLPLTIDFLNRSAPMAPKKDYGANRLVPSPALLQLPPRTQLLVDETALAAGQLSARGVRNLQAVAHLATWQQLKLDFTYHEAAVPLDVPTLSVSRGKAMLPTLLRVPLQPARAAAADGGAAALRAAMGGAAPLADALRKYLAVAQAVAAFEIPDAVTKVVENDFVAERARNRELKAEDFNNWLTVARLLTASTGQTHLTEELWKRALAMESGRVARVVAAAPPVAPKAQAQQAPSAQHAQQQTAQ